MRQFCAAQRRKTPADDRARGRYVAGERRYCAPLAAMPWISSPPRLAVMKARPVIQAGSDRPGEEEVDVPLASPRSR
jgi:hypothetical protein